MTSLTDLVMKNVEVRRVSHLLILFAYWFSGSTTLSWYPFCIVRTNLCHRLPQRYGAYMSLMHFLGQRRVTL
jgi:hypothetical protein